MSDSLPPRCRAGCEDGNVSPAEQAREIAPTLGEVAGSAKTLSLERQAERLSAIGGLAQPPKSARLRAEARTHFLGAKSASLETPLRAFLDCAPLLLGFGRDPLRWALVRWKNERKRRYLTMKITKPCAYRFDSRRSSTTAYAPARRQRAWKPLHTSARRRCVTRSRSCQGSLR